MQNSGAKVLLRNITFSLEIVGADEGALLRERVAGACCGGQAPSSCPSCVLVGVLTQ